MKMTRDVVCFKIKWLELRICLKTWKKIDLN